MANKKTFTAAMQQKATNPTLQFISQSAPEEQPDTAGYSQTQPDIARAEAPKAEAAKNQARPSAPETKSRRLQLLIQPSLHEAIKNKAQAEGLSVNELIHSILDAAIRGRR